MHDPTFTNDIRLYPKAALSKRFDHRGRCLGVDIVVACPECGREITVAMTRSEIKDLLDGKHIQGIVRDGACWRGEVYCPGSGGQSRRCNEIVVYGFGTRALLRLLESISDGRSLMGFLRA